MELDDLDLVIMECLKGGITHNSHTLLQNKLVKSRFAPTVGEYDRWNILKGRLARLEAKEFISQDEIIGSENAFSVKNNG